MIEALILWQLGSARASEKSKYRAENLDQRISEGFVIFFMALAFVVTLFVWPAAAGYRTNLLRKWPAIFWVLIPIFAVLLLIYSPAAYFLIGFVWAIGEFTAFFMRNEHLFN